jgi:Bacterial Ig domain/Glycosyl hydrolase family 26
MFGSTDAFQRASLRLSSERGLADALAKTDERCVTRFSSSFGRPRAASIALIAAGALISFSSASGAPPSSPSGNGPSSKLAITTLAPTSGATVSGSITWQIDVTGGVPSRIDFTIDGALTATDTTYPYYYARTTGGLDTTKLADGSHTLAAAAYPDGKGPVAMTSVTVTVRNQLVVPPTWSVPPTISGTTQSGQTLTSSNGSWSGTLPMSYAHQWLRCNSSGASCVPIQGATSQSYAVGSRDVGSTLRSQVTAANTAGTSSTQSAQTGVVTSAGASSSSILWGAYMDGDGTYTYLYGGSWKDAPWDANTWSRFETNAGKKVSLVHWGINQPPWVRDFNYWTPPLNLVQNAGDLNAVDLSTGSVPLRDIAGGMYDASITTWMQQAAAWGHPFFLILDVEMNGPWEPYSPGNNGNTAADFVAMWHRMHDLAAKAGATNITWVWAPNVDPANIYTPYSQLYPGDSYVDWTGLDGFNKDGKSTFSWIYGSSYKNLLQVAPGKPVMITQIGSVEGTFDKAAWITDALTTQLPNYFPNIKALVWFNWRIYEQSVWRSWEIESSASSQASFKAAIASPYYAPGGSFGKLPLFSKIAAP